MIYLVVWIQTPTTITHGPLKMTEVVNTHRRSRGSQLHVAGLKYHVVAQVMILMILNPMQVPVGVQVPVADSASGMYPGS
jgi:hypothetical protein